MIHSRTITNGLLLILVLLLLPSAIRGIQQPAPTTSPAPEIEEGDSTPPGEEEGNIPTSLTGIDMVDRFLTYSFLILVLALGTESIVEIVRYFLRGKIILIPGPIELLKELDPWLPAKARHEGDPVSAAEQPDEDDEQETALPSDEKHASGDPHPKESSSQDALSLHRDVDVYKEALRGIALHYNKKIHSRSNWTQVFYVLAQKEENYQIEKKKYLRLNRAISFGVAFCLTLLTGVNTFLILLGTEAEESLNWFWMNVGGLLLSAFAASAGASFWHDMFDKLRGSKEAEPPTNET